MKTGPLKTFACFGLALLAAPLGYAQQNPPPHDSVKPAASEEEDEYAIVQVYDPIEPVNRTMFTFNNGVYDYVLRPISKVYVKAVPEPARNGLVNFFANLRFPIRFVNDVLQFKFKRAGLETGKFAVNTVAGLGGFFRVSNEVPALANVPAEDLGQTLGVWGVHKGPYLVLPLLGPGTVRETAGLAGDYFLNPLHWDQLRYVHGYDWWWDTAAQTTDTISTLPGLLQLYDEQKKAALDPYLSVRSAYIQYRDAAVKQ